MSTNEKLYGSQSGKSKNNLSVRLPAKRSLSGSDNWFYIVFIRISSCIWQLVWLFGSDRVSDKPWSVRFMKVIFHFTLTVIVIITIFVQSWQDLLQSQHQRPLLAYLIPSIMWGQPPIGVGSGKQLQNSVGSWERCGSDSLITEYTVP